MNLRPIGDRLIVKPDEVESTTASGLYLAGDAKEKPHTGTVLAIGTGKLNQDGKYLPMPVKVGDRVIFGHYGGNEIIVDGEEVLTLRVDDLYAVYL